VFMTWTVVCFLWDRRVCNLDCVLLAGGQKGLQTGLWRLYYGTDILQTGLWCACCGADVFVTGLR
jgi:hypothetical protein